MKALGLDRGDGVLHRVGNRGAQQIDRHHQDRDGDEHDQGRNESILVPKGPPEPRLQRVKRDRQDQRPQHQVAKRSENLEAKQHHDDNQSGADHYVKQASGQGFHCDRCGRHCCLLTVRREVGESVSPA